MGGVARPHDGLGRVLLSQSIVDVDGIACGSHENVWIDRVDEQQGDGDGEAKCHVQCSPKMPPICLIDVVQMSHFFTSMSEQPVAGEEHGQPTSIGFMNDFLVSN